MARYVLEDDQPKQPGFVLEESPQAPKKQSMLNRVLMDWPGGKTGTPLVDRMPPAVQSGVESFNQGLRDPVMGLMQFIPRAASFVTSAGGLAPNPVSQFFDRGSDAVDEEIKAQEAIVQAKRNAAAQTPKNLSDLIVPNQASADGVDWSRVGGNILSPVSALPAMGVADKVEKGVNAARLAWQGLKSGGLAGLLNPVEDPENYAGKKLAQVGGGAVMGGVTTPVFAKVGEAIAQRISQFAAARARPSSDAILLQAIADAGAKADDFNAAQLASMRAQIDDALKVGKSLDPAALMRKTDFETLGIPALKGQVSRDPAQFAFERNMRGNVGMGEPIAAVLNEQNRALQDRLGQRAAGAIEPNQAGQAVIDRLQGVDDQMRARVGMAYDAARMSNEAAKDVPPVGLAQDVGRIIDDYREAIPGGVMRRLESYGFVNGKQTKVFDMQEAESLLQLINKQGNVTDRGQMSALSELRNAVKKAVSEGASDGGPFTQARMLAASRFQKHEAIPALQDVVEGRASPDKFIEKYVIGGKAAEVKGLSTALDADTKETVRAQIGEYLQRAAFGENTAGDKAFAPERFNAVLRKFGDDKLKAFFTPDEVAELKAIGRVGAYIYSQPANAAVNNSNTGSAIWNLAKATGSGLFELPGLNVLPASVRRYQDTQAVRNALNLDLSAQLPQLTPAQRLRLGMATGLVPVAAAGALPSP